MNNKYSTILIILIILFYFNIINIELFEKNPILLIFLILNIIIINYNKTIGYILLLFLIFNILNIKKNIKGGEGIIIKLYEKKPILLIFLILNIIIINYNETIGYILALFLIFNILNIKKNIKGGGIIDGTAKSIFPMLGVLDGFKNFIDNNKSEKKETYINTNENSSATSTESESTNTESESSNTEETENIIDDNEEDPYEDLLDKDEEDELIEGGFDSLLDF